ncbi:immunity repressor [Gordonia phage Faith5x5]|nr:immunity repressor [Gordonia phage Faith5x5]
MRVSESNLPPEHWRPFFDAINVEFGYRPLANKIGMDHTRLRRCLLGGGTSAETVQKVADVFGIDPGRVRELRGEGRDAAVEPFTLPDDAGRLTHDERNVIRAMVRALLDARDRHATPTDSSATSGTPSEADPHEKTGSKVTALPKRDQAPEPDVPKAARKRDPRFKPEDPDA